MSQRDRKQKKKTERQERLRQEKHLRHFQKPTRLGGESNRTAAGAGGLPVEGNASVAGAGEVNLFASEAARRWLEGLCAGMDSMLIVNALDVSFVPAELVLKASVCEELLAAAEVVAAGRGRPSAQVPRYVIDWLIAQDMLFSPGVVMFAIEGVKRVCEHSQLREVWDASGRAEDWLRAAANLQGRLQG
jgi:hypothetical protein